MPALGSRTSKMSNSRQPRASTHDSKVRALHRYILGAFPRLGRAPTHVEMQRDLRFDRETVIANLRALEVEGGLRLDPVSSRILEACPYSAVPTRHTVVLESGRQLFCLCAIDAFYVPFLAESSVTIHSLCFQCKVGLQIRVERHKILRIKPATAVIWDSADPDPACCPKTNFFCNLEHLVQWWNGMPEEMGQAYAIEAALGRGQRAADRIMRSTTGS